MATNLGVLEVSYEYTLDGKRYTNQLHYRQFTSDSTPASLEDDSTQLLANARQLWIDNINPISVDSIQLRNIRLKYFDTFELVPSIPPAPVGTPQVLFPNPAEEVLGPDLTDFGAIENDFLPGFNSFRALKLTGLPGRRKRGHISIAGVPESGTTGNLLSGAVKTDWFTNSVVFLVSNLVGRITPDIHVFEPVVFSITAARAANAVGQPCRIYAYHITTALPTDRVGTMRRRKKKTS